MNAWDLVDGGAPGGATLADHAAELTITLLVLLLKIVGAAVAIAAVRPGHRDSWLLPAATWGAASQLTLYSTGNLAIAVGTTAGLMEPSAAWTAAGGVTARSIGYAAFFLVGAVLYTVLAVSYQRRHRPRWTALAAGVVGAPALLAGVLVVTPALLTAAGLLPS